MRGPSTLPWIPAFAGMSGVSLAGPIGNASLEPRQKRPSGGRFARGRVVPAANGCPVGLAPLYSRHWRSAGEWLFPRSALRRATWRSGYATVCKTVYPGSIPGVASKEINHLARGGRGRKSLGSFSVACQRRKLPAAGDMYYKEWSAQRGRARGRAATPARPIRSSLALNALRREQIGSTSLAS